MQRRLLLGALAVALMAEATAADRATFKDPLDTPAALTHLAVTSETMAVARAGDRLVAVGPSGRILLSDDRARLWRQVSSPVSSDLVAVQFPTPQVGWAVGHDGVVLHSRDGGRTWTKRLDGRDLNALMVTKYKRLASQGDAEAEAAFKDVQAFAEEGPAKPILDVWFRNEQEGFLVGAFNLIFKTADGGKTWEPWYEHTENPKRFHLNSIRGDGDAVFIVGEQGLVLRLDRDQQRFLAVPTPYPGSLFGVVVKQNVVVVCGLRGHALRSLDGGRSWSEIVTQAAGATYTGGTVVDGGRIVLVDMGGRVMMSTTANGPFSQFALEPRGRVFGVAPAGKNAIALAGDGGVRVVKLK